MTSRFVFRRGVRGEIVAARDWYDKQRDGLGDEFVECVEVALDQIERMPTAAPLVLQDIRVKLVDRFPYVIYYRIKTDFVRVLAVVHTRRDPEVWRNRQ